jgi:hypothetical protein
MAGGLFSPKHILTIITSGIIILICLIVTFLYIKCKALHTYPCYNKLAINIIVLANNIFRVIPLVILNNVPDFLKNAQAFLLIFTDKFFLIILTNQIVIQYFGIMQTNFYFKKEKQIFIYGTILSAMISIALAGVFIKGGYKDKKEKNDKLYYYGNNDEDYKKIIDTVYNGLLLVINVISLIIIIINSSIKSKLAKSSGMGDSNYEHNFTQALIKFIVNAITYIISFLIIHRVITGHGITDFVYLMGCLIVEIAYCFNRAVIKEICKLCFCKTYEEDKMDGPLLKTNTFGGEDLPSNDGSNDG